MPANSKLFATCLGKNDRMKPSPLLSIVKADVLLALAIFNSHCVPITTSVNVRKLTAITKNVELKDALADASSKHQ